MPMIDVYAVTGTFSDKHQLAQDAAKVVMSWEGAGDQPVQGQHRGLRPRPAARLHLERAGDSNYVRVQVLTPVGVLDRDKQLGVVRELTDLVAAAAGDPTLVDRTWVLISESPEGGWGIDGHANTSADIVPAARAELSGS